jgi:hypothetical protein
MIKENVYRALAFETQAAPQSLGGPLSLGSGLGLIPPTPVWRRSYCPTAGSSIAVGRRPDDSRKARNIDRGRPQTASRLYPRFPTQPGFNVQSEFAGKVPSPVISALALR